MPRPVTVTIRSTSGRPVSNTSAMVAAEAAFCTSTPTSIGSPPLRGVGTSRPSSALMSCFSPPCGYFVFATITIFSAP